MRNNEKDLTEYIIKSLARGRESQDLITELIEKMGMSRRDAEVFVIRVETEHDQDIEIRQGPILFWIALVVFVGGVILTVIAGWGLLKPVLNSAFAGSAPVFPDTLYADILELLIGVGLIAGGSRWLFNHKILIRFLHWKP
jgi:hypothetical protein